jgi:cysteine desulfurase
MELCFIPTLFRGFGKLRGDVKKMGIDLLSASAHKIGGPKGVGFLYVGEEVKIKELNLGGGQERGLRSGTENVTGIVGFAKALEMIKKVSWEKVEKLRDKLEEGLVELGGRANGSRTERISGILNVSFSKIDGESLVFNLSYKGIMVSTGSACSSKKKAESRTLKAIGLKKKEIDGSVRFSFNDEISEKDIDFVLGEMKILLGRVKV